MAADEFGGLYEKFQHDPRAMGRRFRHDAVGLEHWVYESPYVPRRPRIRIYYTVQPDERLVSIERIGLI